MPANSAAENALGTIGTVLWTCQLIPQVWKSWREKSTEGLSPWLMFIWASGAIFFGIYAIVKNLNIPLIIQPQLFGALAALSWVQTLFYGKRRSLIFCCATYAVFLGIFAGTEVGASLSLKKSKDPSKALQALAIISPISISLGLIPQYIEICRRREVLGISMLFMAVDMGGGVFSILSLVFKAKFDGLAAATYICVLVLDSVIVISKLILNPRARHRRLQETESVGPIPPQDIVPLEEKDQTHTDIV